MASTWSASAGLTRIVQLTDTHVVPRGERYFRIDTAHYLRAALAFVAHMVPAPAYVVVTGDLVNTGKPQEYEHFASLMAELRVPYVVIPGNHDDREHLRAGLPTATFGDSRTGRVRFAYDACAVRLIGLDANLPRPWPGAGLDEDTLAWLEGVVRAEPERPTMLAVHQPPFRTGLHYLDLFGFTGARRLRRLVEASPQIGRLLSGHIHCVKTARWGGALATTAPSTAPQVVPELLNGRVARLLRERPGFAVHDWTAESGFRTAIYRAGSDGEYAPGP